jgi:hypothetical protein
MAHRAPSLNQIAIASGGMFLFSREKRPRNRPHRMQPPESAAPGMKNGLQIQSQY